MAGIELTAEQKAYLAEIAAEIAENGDASGDLIEEMKAAHARRQTFAAEMRDGSTFRAKAARKAIALSMHTRVQYAANVNRLMYDLQQVAA